MPCSFPSIPASAYPLASIESFWCTGQLAESLDWNEIIFYGVSKREPDKPDKPWIAPLAGGEPRLLRLRGSELNGVGGLVRAWGRPGDGSKWIIDLRSGGRGLEGVLCWRFRARPERRETRTTHFRYGSSWRQFFSRAGWQSYVPNREPHELDLRNSDQ